jgi:hypothetical protein
LRDAKNDPNYKEQNRELFSEDEIIIAANKAPAKALRKALSRKHTHLR